MFESLVRELGSRFDLGDRAGRFLRLLVDALFDGGGPAEVRQRFAGIGLGSQFDSWLRAAPAEDALLPDQFVTGIGQVHSERIASQLGLEPAVVNAAGAYALPRLLSSIARDGVLPESRPADYERWFVAPAAAPAAPVAATSAMPRERETSGGWWKWLIPLLLLVAILLAWRGCKRDADTVAVTNDVAQRPAVTAQATDATFDFANTNGRVHLGGRVPTEADKQRLWQAAVGTFGADNVTGDIAVSNATRPARWIDCVATAMPQLRQTGLKFGFAGERLRVESAGLPEADRFAVTRTLRGGCGGYETTGLYDRASAAFAALKPGYDATTLVNALNLMEIYFDTDSAAITRDSLETLTQAAQAIRGAPAGTRIEVGGHTDNTGTVARNDVLSQERAAAVAAKLTELGVDASMLTPKGYGQSRPKADNATEEGRAQNRRMEFTVLQ